MMMIGRRPLATNLMDRPGDFSSFIFLCLCFAKLPALSPLTSCSAEPRITDFNFIGVCLFVKVQQSSWSAGWALRFSSDSSGHCSLTSLSMFAFKPFPSSFFCFVFFLKNDTANIVKKIYISGAQWRLSLDCCHSGPWSPKRQGDSGSGWAVLSPQEVLRAKPLPPSTSLVIHVCSHQPSPPHTHISAPLTAMDSRLYLVTDGARGGSDSGNRPVGVTPVTFDPPQTFWALIFEHVTLCLKRYLKPEIHLDCEGFTLFPQLAEFS